ncbi:hypothetical protein BT93_A1772 [Corymbia citriodora subsp. variegata]|nr:hypothetical protein BT93_A1772 [Corymbia citriodora subsp. variegata]
MASSSGSKPGPGSDLSRSTSKRMTRAQTMMVDPNDDNSAVDSELVPSSLAPIAPVLRVANEIEKENPRVAYVAFMHLRGLIRWIQLHPDGVFASLRLISYTGLRRKKKRRLFCLPEMILEKSSCFTTYSVKKISKMLNTPKSRKKWQR